MPFYIADCLRDTQDLSSINASAPTPAPMPIRIPTNPQMRRKVAPSPMSGIVLDQRRLNMER
jgi:hypothetical protein